MDSSDSRRKANTARPARSKQIMARKTPEAAFVDLLRRKCIRAAMIGALTAAGEAVPGLSRVLGLVFGELIDARLLAGVQRELVEETFALYGLELPSAMRNVLVSQVQTLGPGASIAGDALARGLLKRVLGGVGNALVRRIVPVTAIVSSALSNALVTYAIGKRAQAIARLRDAPLSGMPDVLRAFSGIDERRVYAWTMEAVNGAFGAIGKSLRRMRLPWSRKATATQPAEAKPARTRTARPKSRRRASSD